jgi:hypothetical protein
MCGRTFVAIYGEAPDAGDVEAQRTVGFDLSNMANNVHNKEEIQSLAAKYYRMVRYRGKPVPMYMYKCIKRVPVHCMGSLEHHSRAQLLHRMHKTSLLFLFKCFRECDTR